MKIVSTFKDYYDSLGSHSGATGVYERFQKKIDVDWIGYEASGSGYSVYYELNTGLLGFCGKIYPNVKYEYDIGNGILSGYVYSLDEYKKVLADIESCKKFTRHWRYSPDIFFNAYPYKINVGKTWFDGDFKSLLESSSRRGGTGSLPKFPNLKSIFIEHKTPCFSIDNPKNRRLHGRTTNFKILLNPKLADYNFYKLFDTFSAFTAIEQFINNEIIRPDDPYIQEIPDKIKAESHGFDKFSFRKEKGKKKRKQKHKIKS
jgi:hypothetical protein